MTARTTEGGALLSDRYKTIACLGENEIATTYWSKPVGEDRHVVVRVPGEALLEHASFAYQLERSALELQRVKHPHILHVLDAGRSESVPFVVTEHCEGESLAHVLLDRGRTQNATQIYDWLFDIAEALDFIHSKKVVHGEVRPTHFFRSGVDAWCITDFTFGAAMGGLDAETRTALAAKQGIFTAPEIRAGNPPSPQSDQYALACCVTLAATGEEPSEDAVAAERTLRSYLTPEATEDVLRAMDPDPQRRFASCYEFARAFGLERKRARRTNGAAEPVVVPFGEGPPPPLRPSAPADFAPPVPAALPTTGMPDAGGPGAPEGARCWRIRMGPGDRYARLGRERGFVAAGWDELGDLADLAGAEDAVALPDLVGRFERAYGVTGAAARVGAGQVWRFASEMRPDDFVLLPDAPEGVLHVGRVEGDYRWNEAPTDGCRLPRRRAVIWVRDVPLADVPNAVVRALEGTETLTNLDGLRTRVLDLAAGRSAAMSAGMGEAALLERVVASIHAVGEDAFPGFLRGLFAALGYDAEVLPGRRDGWWEALGRVSASGLADVVLRVAASRVLGELDVDRVYAMRGSLATEEQGAVLTLGGFTAAARAEASARGKKPVRLVDGPTLAALAIEHWDDLPPATRKALGLQRVERATIEVRFEPASGT